MASVSRLNLINSALTATSTGSASTLEARSTEFIGWLDISVINGATTVASKIQHSADGTNFVDLIAFTNAVGAVSRQAVAVTIPVLPYVRAVATLSGVTQTATVSINLYYDYRRS